MRSAARSRFRASALSASVSVRAAARYVGARSPEVGRSAARAAPAPPDACRPTPASSAHDPGGDRRADLGVRALVDAQLAEQADRSPPWRASTCAVVMRRSRSMPVLDPDFAAVGVLVRARRPPARGLRPRRRRLGCRGRTPQQRRQPSTLTVESSSSQHSRRRVQLTRASAASSRADRCWNRVSSSSRRISSTSGRPIWPTSKLRVVKRVVSSSPGSASVSSTRAAAAAVRRRDSADCSSIRTRVRAASSSARSRARARRPCAQLLALREHRQRERQGRRARCGRPPRADTAGRRRSWASEGLRQRRCRLRPRGSPPRARAAPAAVPPTAPARRGRRGRSARLPSHGERSVDAQQRPQAAERRRSSASPASRWARARASGGRARFTSSTARSPARKRRSATSIDRARQVRRRGHQADALGRVERLIEEQRRVSEHVAGRLLDRGAALVHLRGGGGDRAARRPPARTSGSRRTAGRSIALRPLADCRR